MADYNEETVAGNVTSWRRAFDVRIKNSYNVPPVAYFFEEDVVRLPSGKVVQTSTVSQPLIEAMTDPQKEFDLLHPETGEKIGTATYQDLYVMMRSLYMALATRRDEAQR